MSWKINDKYTVHMYGSVLKIPVHDLHDCFLLCRKKYFTCALYQISSLCVRRKLPNMGALESESLLLCGSHTAQFCTQDQLAEPLLLKNSKPVSSCFSLADLTMASGD